MAGGGLGLLFGLVVAGAQAIVGGLVLGLALLLGGEEAGHVVARGRELEDLLLGDGLLVELVGADEVRMQGPDEVVAGGGRFNHSITGNIADLKAA